MPVEAATYIGDLVASNPPSGDPLGQGQNHIRLLKTVLQSTFPHITAAVTATATSLNAVSGILSGPTLTVPAGSATGVGGLLTLAGGPQATGTVAYGSLSLANENGVVNALNNAGTVVATLTQAGDLTALGTLNASAVNLSGSPLVPRGVIVMWTGTTAPAGWALCDGTNGTPDLRSRFVIGAGSTYAAGAVGGSSSVAVVTDTQGAHSHSGATGSAGSHSHGGAVASYTLTLNDIPNHTHGVTDTGHAHSLPGQTIQSGPGIQGTASGYGYAGNTTGSATTGISIVAAGGGGGHTHGIAADGAHTHTISQDGAHAHNVTVATLPPFYALAFIMKL